MAPTHVKPDDQVLKAIDDQVGQRGRRRFLGRAGEREAQRIGLEGGIYKGAGILKDEDYRHCVKTGRCRPLGAGKLTVYDLPAR
jgi:hypothetical protein